MNALPGNLPHVGTDRKFDSPDDVARKLEPQQPVQCFSSNVLAQRVRLFQNNFPGRVSYAVKANPNAVVIRAAALAGLETFDIASPAEMALVSAHAPGAEMHYHNPVRSRREVELAWHHYGCRRFSIDDPGELRKILEIVEAPEDIEIAVRFRLAASGNAVHDFSEKFGATPQAAVHLLAQVKLCGFVPVLTFHPGSQCLDPASWHQHIVAAAEIAQSANVKIAKLNVGGGFPVSYASHAAPDLKHFFRQIRQTALTSFGADDIPNLECEPGRAIVGPSVSVLTRVKLVRNSSREVFLNDGIYGNLMESTQAPSLQPKARIIRNGSKPSRNQQPFIIYGPTCDPLDRLPGTIMLPTDIREDDYIEFQNLGAYGAATATRFNGYGETQMLQVGVV